MPDTKILTAIAPLTVQEGDDITCNVIYPVCVIVEGGKFTTEAQSVLGQLIVRGGEVKLGGVVDNVVIYDGMLDVDTQAEISHITIYGGSVSVDGFVKHIDVAIVGSTVTGAYDDKPKPTAYLTIEYQAIVDALHTSNEVGDAYINIKGGRLKQIWKGHSNGYMVIDKDVYTDEIVVTAGDITVYGNRPVTIHPGVTVMWAKDEVSNGKTKTNR